MTDKAGHFVITSLSYSTAHSCKELLQPAVAQFLQRCRLEVFLLPHLQLAEALFGQIQLNVRKFIQRNVAILVLHQSDDDTEENGVVAFLFAFKNEPPHSTERKDGTANSVLSLAVLGIERTTVLS